ncbi:serine threonine protein kinase [Bacillus stratosphericus LAMA 585]|nr:serine threonine protein kinase [Bacillus stratosphericus LAMA 585]
MEDFSNMENKTQLELWKELAQGIFKENTHETQVITDVDEIISVLDKIGKSSALNHAFYPSGGGDDLLGAALSAEADCIELIFGSRSASVIKPVSLSFNPISDNPEYWYYRINTRSFEPSGVYNEQTEEVNSETDQFKTEREKALEHVLRYTGEELTEIGTNSYVERYHWDEGFYGHDENGYEKKLPESARLITRMHKGGDFVIFSKFSIYNQDSSTYDARHNKLSEEEFKTYIKENADKRK